MSLCDCAVMLVFLVIFVHVNEGMTRINVKVKAAEETELNGQGPAITAENVEELLAKLDQLVEGDTLRYFRFGSYHTSS